MCQQKAILSANKDVKQYVDMLLSAGSDVNVIDLYGLTPLNCVISRHKEDGSKVTDLDLNLVEMVLKSPDIDINLTSTAKYWFQFHGTSLQMAVERDSTKLVQLLLMYGADPDIPGGSNR